MAENVCKNCRAATQKLFLKGEKCYGQKCPVARRTYSPGQHGGASRRKISEYGRQLHEKQRAKAVYGLNEEQLKRVFNLARVGKGKAGENLLNIFELRLDSVLFKAGFYPSRAAARQAVTHGKIAVNNVKSQSPSFLLKENDTAAVIKKIKDQEISKETPPNWLKVDKNKLTASIIHSPMSEGYNLGLEEQLIVESLSR